MARKPTHVLEAAKMDLTLSVSPHIKCLPLDSLARWINSYFVLVLELSNEETEENEKTRVI